LAGQRRGHALGILHSQRLDQEAGCEGAVAAAQACDGEFWVQEIVEASIGILDSGFGNSHVNQMLGALANAGLVYKNRRGKYSFAVL
jgi:hypothetical protein